MTGRGVITILAWEERVVAGLFWLSEAQMARLPNKLGGVPRVDDRRVISGIVQVLISGGRGSTRLPSTSRARRCATAGSAGMSGRLAPGLCRAGGSQRSCGRARARQHPRQGVPLRRRRPQGARAQATGRSRGERTTRLHAMVDKQRRPVALASRPASTAMRRPPSASPARHSHPARSPPTPPTTATPCGSSCWRAAPCP